MSVIECYSGVDQVDSTTFYHKILGGIGQIQ
jgi:hypothetical protein